MPDDKGIPTWSELRERAAKAVEGPVTGNKLMKLLWVAALRGEEAIQAVYDEAFLCIVQLQYQQIPVMGSVNGGFTWVPRDAHDTELRE